MKLALDTNVCVAVLRERPPAARRRLNEALADGKVVTVSSVVVHELNSGVLRSDRIEHNRGEVRVLLEPMEIIPFDADDAQASAEIGDDLRRRGLPIGGYDLLIAGQARRRGLTLVTSNSREFARIPGLKLQDWLT